MKFRKLTKAEEETHGIKCSIIRDDNKLRCTRKVQFAVDPNDDVPTDFYCGGHFQELRQLAINSGEQIEDLDQPTTNATDEIKPL